MRKLIDYKVYSNYGVDHVTWREALKLIQQQPTDIHAVSRVTRWWYDDGSLEKEEEEFLFVTASRVSRHLWGLPLIKENNYE